MNVIGDGNNQFARLLDSMPAKRVGRMEDVAGTVLYLCSQAGVSRAMLSTFHGGSKTDDVYQSYVDGRCLCIDGGRTLFANGQ